MGRLRVVPVSDLHLRRDLRAVWFRGRTPPAGAVPICSVTSDRSRLRVISGCARPDLEPRAFTAGCTPGPWPAGPRREWLTGLAGGYLNPCPGVVNVSLRVPQVNGGLGLCGGRGVPGSRDDLSLPGGDVDDSAPLAPRPGTSVLAEVGLTPAAAAVCGHVHPGDATVVSGEGIAGNLGGPGTKDGSVARAQDVGVDGDGAEGQAVTGPAAAGSASAGSSRYAVA